MENSLSKSESIPLILLAKGRTTSDNSYHDNTKLFSVEIRSTKKLKSKLRLSIYFDTVFLINLIFPEASRGISFTCSIRSLVESLKAFSNSAAKRPSKSFR